LPPRKRASFQIVDPKPLSRARGLAAQAAAGHTSASQDPLVRAYSVPGIDGAGLLLTRRNNDVCLSAIEPAAGDFPRQWASSCNTIGREHGTGLAIGDTFVGVVRRDGVAPTYKAPSGPTIELRPNKDGLIVIKGAADRARVRFSEAYPTTIEIGRDVRYYSSDGTSLDERVDQSAPREDPCAP
jgi:hypothetical protein